MQDELYIYYFCPFCRNEEIETLSDGSLYCRKCNKYIEGVKVINEPDIEEEL